MIDKKLISKVMSQMAKDGHKKKPRSREFYVAMGKKGAKTRWSKKLSPTQPSAHVDLP